MQRADTIHAQAELAYQNGDLKTAAELLHRCIELDPRAAGLHANLGMILGKLGRIEQAIRCYHQAISSGAEPAEAYSALGSLFRRGGQIAASIDAYRRAIALRPDLAEACNNLGNVLMECHRSDEAIAAYRQALAHRPLMPEAHLNLGCALHHVGRSEDAMACCERALELKPGCVAGYNLLGNIHYLAGRLNEAAAAFKKAVDLDPVSAETLNNLGMALRDVGELDLAAQSLRRALELRPDLSDASRNLGETLRSASQLDEAIRVMREGLCRRAENYLASALIYTLHFHPGYGRREIFDEAVGWREVYADPLKPGIRPHDNDPTPNRSLRIGYCGAYLGNHPQGRLLAPLFQNHDHARFEIFCYDNGRKTDHVAQKLRECSDVWRPTAGLTDSQVARMVHEDRIDVLVDLATHTGANRLITFALKPAPVQVSYLAYCSTSGLDTIDYRISDRYLDPPERDDGLYAEKTVRLPHCFWQYPAPPEAPPVGSPPALTNGLITFGCLNDFAKVNSRQLRLWAQLLRELPHSYLLLHAREGSHRNSALAQFEHDGVNPQRVRFAGLMPLSHYFELYNQIDIALDTFPYAGGTTTIDALWMGVPVVSRYGQTAVSRGGLSILSNLGLADLVGAGEESYVRIARELACDLPRLTNLRASLRERMLASPLMDAAAFTRDIEGLYRQMWRVWCDSAGPQHEGQLT